jgi:large subunit ribosomal protein L25
MNMTHQLELQLKTETRNVFGKKLADMRKIGKLPAVLYGRGIKTTPLFVSLSDFKKLWKEAGESTIIELKIDESKNSENVIINDVAFEPIKNELIHVDFYKVEMDKPITAVIPLVFEGVALAVKKLGGVLVKVRHDIEIEALPKNLPHAIKVDISKLTTFDDRISVADLDLSEGVVALTKLEEIVALVEEIKEEKILEKETDIKDIEVEKRGRDKEEEIEK